MGRVPYFPGTIYAIPPGRGPMPFGRERAALLMRLAANQRQDAQLRERFLRAEPHEAVLISRQLSQLARERNRIDALLGR